MIEQAAAILALVCALGAALMAGTFFAFSTFVMRALARLPAAEGIRAMQSINVVVQNPIFLGVFMGTAGTSIALVGVALMAWNDASPYRLAAGLMYVVGTFGVTIAFNVPRNRALAAVPPESTEGAVVWKHYVTTWTAWNHVRTVAAVLSTAALVAAGDSQTSDGLRQSPASRLSSREPILTITGESTIGEPGPRTSHANPDHR